jgi:hypothetical protein
MKRIALIAAFLLVAAIAAAGAADVQGAGAGGACLLSMADLPVFVLDEDGALRLTDLDPAGDNLLLKLEPVVAVATKAPCNGGTNTCAPAGGTAVLKQCPFQGGPVCDKNEKCKCLCDTSDGAVYNDCTE